MGKLKPPTMVSLFFFICVAFLVVVTVVVLAIRRKKNDQIAKSGNEIALDENLRPTSERYNPSRSAFSNNADKTNPRVVPSDYRHYQEPNGTGARNIDEIDE